MAIELYAIAGNALLHFLLLFFAQQLYNDFKKGIDWSFGNREDQEFDAYSERVKRTIANHIENTVIFVPLALAVVVAKKTSWVTETGALLFVFSRLGYSIAYIAGIKYLRTFIWFGGVAGYWMVAWPFYAGLFGK